MLMVSSLYSKQVFDTKLIVVILCVNVMYEIYTLVCRWKLLTAFFFLLSLTALLKLMIVIRISNPSESPLI